MRCTVWLHGGQRKLTLAGRSPWNSTITSSAVTVLLGNAVQQSARNQLGTVDPYHGAAAVDPHDASARRRSTGCGSTSCAPAGGGDNPGRKDEQGNMIYRCNVHGQYRLHFMPDATGRGTFISVNTHDELLL